jgi:hypothetical protein
MIQRASAVGVRVPIALEVRRAGARAVRVKDAAARTPDYG